MNLAENLTYLRKQSKLTQEQFAQILKQSVTVIQDWESGKKDLEIADLMLISKTFSISLDAFVSNKEEAKNNLSPKFFQLEFADSYADILETEYIQSYEEGYDIERYKPLFEAIKSLPRNQYKEQFADVLFQLLQNVPLRKDYPYYEPSNLEAIQALSNQSLWEEPVLEFNNLENKVKGAWYGRISGCLLGKTVEGIKTNELVPFLKETNNYPMHRYILSTDITEDILKKYSFHFQNTCYADKVECAPVDDDTNYTALYQMLIEKNGKDFLPKDVANLWLSTQPEGSYFTAERVAFCNFIRGYLPPVSAIYKNPYREWIGAQIRGDYFGYIYPGNPKSAAELAWKDASISHIKNGIYGEMFVSAMIACAAVCDDIEKIILGGLSQIPTTSRLYAKINEVLGLYHQNTPKEKVFEKIHQEYDEYTLHGWCHTISNAMIVVTSLLYGQGNFKDSICMAVQTGFDTDCNGATVGSILGMRNGFDSLDSYWYAPLKGIQDTSIFGIGKVSIQSLVDKTLKHIAKK